ncbi:MAG: hypothetical protein EXR52_08155 [Dehalococcoidia bacterium]|nr:hypothetical protein [Dehalococcoidia bacterium]
MERAVEHAGSGLRAQGSGLRDQGPGTRDQGPGTRDQGLDVVSLRGGVFPRNQRLQGRGNRIRQLKPGGTSRDKRLL